jgi:hypothetical protein
MRTTILAGSIALFAICSQANAQTELENNNTTSSAQTLPLINGSTTVNATISDKSDVDFYSFYGKAGDVINFDIDGGIGGAESVDTILTVFSPAPDYQILRMVDDADDIDSGSTSIKDARIDKFTLPVTGKYYVAVTRFATFFASSKGIEPRTANYDGFSHYYGKVASNKGDYTLTVAHDAPPVQQIAIEIKPGSSGASPINPKSNGKIPVALLSSPLFAALNIDVNSLTFGSTGNEKSLVKCNWTGDNVNGDGHVDRICHFDNQLAGFKHDDLEGILRGKTLDGTLFEGRGFLKVVPRAK